MHQATGPARAPAARRAAAPSVCRAAPTPSVRAPDLHGSPLVLPNGARPRCACGGRCPRCTSKPSAVTLGRPGDAAEQEADALATRVSGVSPARRAAPRVLNEPAAALVAAEVARIDAQPGRTLDAPTRDALQPHFGIDLDSVRLHDDNTAAASARRLHAHAYAIGPHIVFGAGRYAPGNAAGRHLLAHELAHLAQPHSQQVLRRDVADYTISQLPGDAAGDANTIYFLNDGVAIPAEEQIKIAALAKPADQALTLHGFDSEEEGPFERAMKVDSRLNVVEQALKAAGHKGKITRLSHSDAGVGQINYRRLRKVEVLPTPKGQASAATTEDACNMPGSEDAKGKTLADCERTFKEAFKPAQEVVDKAEKDVVTSPTKAADDLVGKLFAGVPRAAVDANVTAIAKQVRQLPARHRCRTSCDGGCDRPAYNDGAGLGATGAMMSLCPTFTSAGLDFRTELLIHEASHGNPVSAIKDVAYSTTRQVRFLLPADAVRNTDSYVLLMRLVHKAGSMVIGPAAADVITGMSAIGPNPEIEQVQRAIAWLESWLNYGDFDTSILYSTIVESLAQKPPAWVVTNKQRFNVATMHRLAIAFAPDLSDPGPDGSPPVGAPTLSDKTRVAAIHDRYSQLYPVVNHKVLKVQRAAKGESSRWMRWGPFPSVSDTVRVDDGFFVLSQAAQVRYLLALMVAADKAIGTSFEPKYVRALDLIRVHRGLGP
jgi:Domain of unknown function (DUF4157)